MDPAMIAAKLNQLRTLLGLPGDVEDVDLPYAISDRVRALLMWADMASVLGIAPTAPAAPAPEATAEQKLAAERAIAERTKRLSRTSPEVRNALDRIALLDRLVDLAKLIGLDRKAKPEKLAKWIEGTLRLDVTVTDAEISAAVDPAKDEPVRDGVTAADPPAQEPGGETEADGAAQAMIAALLQKALPGKDLASIATWLEANVDAVAALAAAPQTPAPGGGTGGVDVGGGAADGQFDNDPTMAGRLRATEAMLAAERSRAEKAEAEIARRDAESKATEQKLARGAAEAEVDALIAAGRIVVGVPEVREDFVAIRLADPARFTRLVGEAEHVPTERRTPRSGPSTAPTGEDDGIARDEDEQRFLRSLGRPIPEGSEDARKALQLHRRRRAEAAAGVS